MDVVNIDKVQPFITKDGSQIRELLAHRNSCIEKQSLAEARLPVGSQTTVHYHKQTEEIYFLLEGLALMQIGGESRHVRAGDSIAIPAGRLHQITNTGDVELRFLCICVPPYEHTDTVLVE
jgi:mannose-6-phosphate isomerase-like protein (cupin superfamily)